MDVTEAPHLLQQLGVLAGSYVQILARFQPLKGLLRLHACNTHQYALR